MNILLLACMLMNVSRLANMAINIQLKVQVLQSPCLSKSEPSLTENLWPQYRGHMILTCFR